MKSVLALLLTLASMNAFAGHPKCAGSSEPEKCEAFQAQLTAETPTEKAARTKRLEASRLATAAKVSNCRCPHPALGSARRDGVVRFPLVCQPRTFLTMAGAGQIQSTEQRPPLEHRSKGFMGAETTCTLQTAR